MRSEVTKGEAQESLRALIRSRVNAKDVQPADSAELTFETAAKNYLRLKKGDWGPKMRSCLASIFNKHIIPSLGPKRVMEIKPSDVKTLFNNLAQVGSESLVRKVITHVRAVFEMLLEDDILKKNPARAKMVTTPKTRKQNERFLKLSECHALLNAAQGRDYIILLILLSCALRPSEVFALRLDDVLPGNLRIDEAAVPGSTNRATKTKDSDGRVPISPRLEAELRVYIREARITAERDFLFPSQVGTAMNHENYRERVLNQSPSAQIFRA